jgi:pSer/pThr/pTyr-binding forkhead associated (FHA) protein
LEEGNNDVIGVVCLLITDGPMKGHTFAIKTLEPVIIGRAKESTIQIPYDSFCSRKHAQIVYKDGKYFLEDLKSTNGTSLNESPIETSKELKNNDKIKFGNTEAVFLVKEEVGQPKTPLGDVFLGD